ncbi:MAG: DUF2304 family protein [Candidatus Jacksonbacteria bacterium]|jgi:small membrane protein|nr:DUF2304 family protein [Candidatus Jacksonbacteria bacterium]MBT6034566.1 DUF2304 family protein [Candidatus Jacksonbacteria bacterium]MBT6301523.1 DUF2304 family protein [Candidatus Jacksonbacteria bacterium]MBT6757574.1 DUF2304 family protein [Candidatus Jacksonbacteria bacterium]MBT6955304.1 DUF2304 family protein [Candidatus Jacksonbacteria bacterium]
MTIFQIAVLVFIAFIILRVLFRFSKKELTSRETVLWCFFWLVSGFLVGFMRKTDVLAQQFGIERGADLFVAISIVVGYYIMFRVFVHIEKIERDITTLTRKLALKDHEEQDRYKQG